MSCTQSMSVGDSLINLGHSSTSKNKFYRRQTYLHFRSTSALESNKLVERNIPCGTPAQRDSCLPFSPPRCFVAAALTRQSVELEKTEPVPLLF